MSTLYVKSKRTQLNPGAIVNGGDKSFTVTALSDACVARKKVIPLVGSARTLCG